MRRHELQHIWLRVVARSDLKLVNWKNAKNVSASVGVRQRVAASVIRVSAREQIARKTGATVRTGRGRIVDG
jgi:hypothetical protein